MAYGDIYTHRRLLRILYVPLVQSMVKHGITQLDCCMHCIAKQCTVYCRAAGLQRAIIQYGYKCSLVFGSDAKDRP